MFGLLAEDRPPVLRYLPSFQRPHLISFYQVRDAVLLFHANMIEEFYFVTPLHTFFHLVSLSIKVPSCYLWSIFQFFNDNVCTFFLESCSLSRLILVFPAIHYSTYWRVSIFGDFHEIEIQTYRLL